MKTNLLAVPLMLACLADSVRAIELDEDALKLSGIETAELVSKSVPAEVAVFGSVLSPAPLIDLIRQTDTARAEIAVSKESLVRLEKLFTAGELVARKDVDAAKAVQVRNLAALQGLEDRLALEWGPWFSAKSPAERDSLIKELLAGTRAIIRLAIPRGEALAAKPLAARLHAFSQENETIRATNILPASTVDAAYQAQPYLAFIETRGTHWPVGLSLSGVMELDGKPREGRFIQQSAVVFYLGKGWVYQRKEDGSFERFEIDMDAPVDGGWLATGGEMSHAKIVTKGAQALLSKETLAPAEDE